MKKSEIEANLIRDSFRFETLLYYSGVARSSFVQFSVGVKDKQKLGKNKGSKSGRCEEAKKVFFRGIVGRHDSPYLLAPAYCISI